MRIEQIVRETLAAYSRGDMEAALKHCAEGVQFCTQATGRFRTWGFDCKDKDQLREALVVINTEFEMLGYDLVEIIASGNRAATRQNVRMKSHATGEIVESQISDWWTVEDGKVASIQEFADTALIAAQRPG